MRFSKQSSLATKKTQTGFALVVTVTIMILLSLIAVGLLSLSSATLRSTSNASAESEARANARLALTMAIGQLQKNLGPDNRISATAELVSPDTTNPHITGSWNSWKFDPNTPPTAQEYTQAGKSDKFLGWLASSQDSAESDDMAVIPGEGDANSITLLSDTLSNATDTSNEVRAETVLIQGRESGEVTGAYAYAVLDEGVKARIDLGEYEREGSLGMNSSNLGNAQRNSIENTELLADTNPELLNLGDPEEVNAEAENYLSKFITTETSQLALEEQGGVQGQLKDSPHDFTIDSLSVLSNATDGGLKMDFSLFTGLAQPPSSLLGQGVYATAFEDFDEVTDPQWSLFRDYAGLYQDEDRIDFEGGNGPVVSASIPEGWQAGQYEGRDERKFQALTAPLPGTVLLPSIAKVQVAFSLAVRDTLTYRGAPGADSAQLHSPWGNRFKANGYYYVLHLLYTPIITLYNPYNVEMEFSDLAVEFSNVPLSLQVFRNNVATTTGLVPFNRLSNRTDDISDASRLQKRFRVSLSGANSRGAPDDNVPLRLLPGEAKIFSPYILPSRSWQQEITDNSERLFSDWTFNDDAGDGNTSLIRTDQIVATPGYRGVGIGYGTDWLQPDGFQTARDNARGLNGVIGLKPSDNIHIEFVPAADIDDRAVRSAVDGKFSVAMYLESSGTDDPVSVHQFDFGSGDQLREALIGEGQTLRFPESGEVNALDLHDRFDVGVGAMENTQAFTVISAYAKTTLGNSDATDFDGRYATKSQSFNNPTLPIVFHDITSENMSQHSHNLDAFTFEGIAQGLDDLTSLDNDDRSPFFTSYDGSAGRKFATQFEIPLSPLQSLTTLNSANPIASGLLPLFNNPIGNSYAHPLLATSEVSTPSATQDADQAGGRYNYLDHSFLLNHALFDQTWLSTFADRSAGLLDGKTLATQLEDFYQEDINSSLEPRLEPFLPSGFSADEPASLLG